MQYMYLALFVVAEVWLLLDMGWFVLLSAHFHLKTEVFSLDQAPYSYMC